METEHVVVLTTAPSREEGQRLAHELVEARLAACVQISAQIQSIYRWNGKVYDEPEWQLWIKTAANRVDEILSWIPQHHSAEAPEIIVLPITGGWSTYLDWIVTETRPGART